MKNYIYFFIILYLLSSIVFSEESHSYPIFLDCSNYRFFDSNLNQKSNFDYTQSFSFISDTTFINNRKNNSINLWANLASEIGEPLVSRINGEIPTYNREHMVFGGSEINLLQGKLQLKGGYNHLGSYSDSMEAQYFKLISRYNKLPKHADIGDFGISENMFSICKINLPSISIRSVFDKYGNWILLPVLYDPIYQTGYAYLQDIRLSLKNDTISLSTDLDIADMYLDHENPSDFNSFTLDLNWSHTFHKDFSIGAQISSNSNYSSDFFLSLQSRLFLSSNLSLNTTAGFWEDMKGDGSIELQWLILPNFKSKFSMEYHYIPSEDIFTYLGPTDTTTYSSYSFHQKQLNLFLECDSIVDLPIHLQTWFKVSKGYKRYLISTNSDRILITQDHFDKWLNGIGGKVDYDIKLCSQLIICPWFQGNYFFRKHLPEEIPFESGIDLKYTFTGTVPMTADLSLTCRTPYTWRALKNNVEIKKSTESLLFCNLSLSVPFVSPIFSKHFSPEFYCQAGPIHLKGDDRQQMHPFGSIIGPVISAKLLVDIY